VVMAWGLLRQYLPEDAEEAYESPHSGWPVNYPGF
jgi:hypothetical protein